MSLADDVEYLCQASMKGREAFEQSRLNHVDLLLKERRMLDAEIRKEQAAADVARMLIESERLREATGAPAIQTSLPFRELTVGKTEAA